MEMALARLPLSHGENSVYALSPCAASHKSALLSATFNAPCAEHAHLLGVVRKKSPRLSEEKGGANYLTHEKHRRGSALHLRRACARLRGSVRARLIAREKINCLWAEAKNYVS
jgi:hypothetical protein